jgi:hypothetical protein
MKYEKFIIRTVLITIALISSGLIVVFFAMFMSFADKLF